VNGIKCVIIFRRQIRNSCVIYSYPNFSIWEGEPPPRSPKAGSINHTILNPVCCTVVQAIQIHIYIYIYIYTHTHTYIHIHKFRIYDQLLLTKPDLCIEEDFRAGIDRVRAPFGN
jgi:hypothetical protein